MTIKKFVQQNQFDTICITGHVNKILKHQFDDYTLRPVYRFPENGMHIEKQAAFVKNLIRHKTNAAIILTHSAFIVSDFPREKVLVIAKNGTCESPEFNTFGASVNKINMCLFGRRATISDLAVEALENISKMPMDTLEQIKVIKDRHKSFGDSIELTLIYHTVFDREDELKKEALCFTHRSTSC